MERKEKEKKGKGVGVLATLLVIVIIAFAIYIYVTLPPRVEINGSRVFLSNKIATSSSLDLNLEDTIKGVPFEIGDFEMCGVEEGRIWRKDGILRINERGFTILRFDSKVDGSRYYLTIFVN